MQSYSKSHIDLQQQIWVQFDKDANTKVIRQNQIVDGNGYSYRKVHYTREDKFKSNFWDNNQVFEDPQWPKQRIDLHNVHPERKLVLKRLIRLYTKNTRPKFFPLQQSLVNKNLNPLEVPPCLKEMNLFPISHYKSLFITQDFQQNGLYHILINVDGRWQTDVVDDYIPIYQDTEEPLWGMDINHPWAIILLKFWAKRFQGYGPVKNVQPMEFIQCFTNSNWKYYNLGKDGLNFLNYYQGKVQDAFIVAKTKASQQVQNAGLVSDSAGYQILNIVSRQMQATQPSHFLVTVKSVLKNRWAGNMSVVDREVNNVYNSKVNSIRLQRDFILNGQDFLNLFVSSYIASRREQRDYYSTYYLLRVPPNQKNALYMSFNIGKQQGFFDFAIKQFRSNKMTYDQNKSRLASQNEMGRSRFGTASRIPGQKFLDIKYMLAFDRASLNKSPNSRHQIQMSQNNQFYTPRYEIYDIEYHKGYGPGQAHFNRTQKGRYILRIKTEKVDRQTEFVVNYCSNSKFDMQEFKPNKAESSFMMRQAVISALGKVPRMSIDRGIRAQQIAFGNTFEDIGYGYIAVKSKKSNAFNILLEFDPQVLHKHGYWAKNQFKNNNEPFSILVKPGQSTSIIFKKKGENASQASSWPPQNALKIFTQKVK